MKTIIFDTETTGLPAPKTSPIEKQPHIIEIGCLHVETGEEFNQLLKPPVEISAEITKITGITNEDVADAPAFADIIDQIKEFFAGADVLIAHNAPFDVKMLQFELDRLGCTDFPWPKKIVCSMQEYQPIIGYRPKLINLYEHFVGSAPEQTHRAIEDVRLLHTALSAAKYYDTTQNQD